MKRWLPGLLWFGWGLLVLLLLAAHAIGQRSIWTTMLVFGPVSWWALSALGIVVLAFKFDRRLSALSAVTAFMIAAPIWEYHTHHPLMPQDASGALRVLTCNRGQHNGHSLAGIIAEQNPDILAFQESNDPGAYVPAAPEFAAYPYRSRVSEFQLVSRYPIVGAKICVLQTPRHVVASQPWFKVARFEVETPAGKIAVFNLHLLSPRHEVRSFLHAKIAEEKQREKVEKFEQEQGALLEETMKLLESEPLPTIACGDYNVPALGPLYRRMTRELQDSHRYAGIGYGFSFPGDVTLPLTGGQWLRIDYVLASRVWEVLRCDVEKQMGSQHSAVISTLRLR